MRHEHGEIGFEVPRHWSDRTIVAYSAPRGPNDPTTANIVLTKDVLEEDQTLTGYADLQVRELSQRVNDFVLQGRASEKIDGLDAVELRFSSKGTSGPLNQRLLIVVTGKRQLYCFTATSPTKDDAQMAPLFDRIIKSITFGGHAPAEHASQVRAQSPGDVP